ncbi:MAG: hypothetical protein FWD75_10570, partial [Propionibacteriaceae bacterium]|nr:hypothetical protein [Propionibacteriaceae bacterium]
SLRARYLICAQSSTVITYPIMVRWLTFRPSPLAHYSTVVDRRELFFFMGKCTVRAPRIFVGARTVVFDGVCTVFAQFVPPW